jgi:MFS family permease
MNILRGRNFWPLWLSILLSNLTDGVVKFGLPIIAMRLTSDISQIAGLSAVAALAWPIFALPAGLMVDRIDRRWLIICANLFRAGLMLILAIAISKKELSIWMLYLIAFSLTAIETLADTAAASIIPTVVESSRLDWANGLTEGTRTVSNEFIGPPLAGALLATGIVLPSYTACLGYFAAALSLLPMNGRYRPKTIYSHSPWNAAKEGILFIWNSSILRTLCLSVALMAGAWTAWFSVFPIYVLSPGPVNLDEKQYGLLLVSLAIGSTIGSFVVSFMVSRFGRRNLLLFDLLSTFVLVLSPALTSNAFVLSFILAAGGLGSTMWNVNVSTIRAKLVPDELMGRTIAAGRFIGWSSMPIGAGLATMSAKFIGLQGIFILSAAAVMVALFLFLQLENTAFEE